MARLKNWGSRKDENHAEVVRYFEQLKCRVLDISSVPNACDIIVKRGQTVRFVEIKDPIPYKDAIAMQKRASVSSQRASRNSGMCGAMSSWWRHLQT